MKRTTALVVLGLVTLLSAPSIAADLPVQFAIGQEWTVKPSNNDDAATLHVVIGKIEQVGGRTVVHVSLTGIRCPSGTTVSLGHAPIDADALSASVDRVVAIGVPTTRGFEQSYGHWKADQGGAFTVSVPEIAAQLLKEVGPEKIGCSNQSGR